MLRKMKRACNYCPYEWSAFGYEILSGVDPREFDLVGRRVTLRHNSRSEFHGEVREDTRLHELIRGLELEGKKQGNKHISGFCCVAERTRIGADLTVRQFVERNQRRLLELMARKILFAVGASEPAGARALRDGRRRRGLVDLDSEEVITLGSEDGEDEGGGGGAALPVPLAPAAPVPSPPPVAGAPALEDLGSEGRVTWPLLVYAAAGRASDSHKDWLNFLLMCQSIANALGVSHQEAVYHNCIKMEMTRRQVPHISHFHCVQRMPGGDMAKIGELDLLVELPSGQYLVELKVCDQWRRFENQIKKYINAVHSMGYKPRGAAIVNFNPKGVIECAMFDAATRHAPSPCL